MKKVLSLLMVISILMIALVSCANGASVPLFKIENANKVDSLLKGDVVAYSEKIVFNNTSNYQMFYYYERSSTTSSYNIYESLGEVKHYLYEGNVYSESNEDLCFILTSDFSLTYQLSVLKYLNAMFPLDLGQRYQRTAKNNDDGTTTVVYYSTVTPQMASDILMVELKPDDTILSEYTLDAQLRVISVKYSIEQNSGEVVEVATREFEYFTNKLNYFDNLPKEMNVSVTLNINGRDYSFDAPNGVYLGLEDNGSKHEYFIDATYTEKYDFIAFGKLQNDVTVYVKK
ncbi:MAG: hypothetical protein MJ236_06895 [Clostridia bacterium]|nr:hypothetical protein [Clostridia bacterium]